MSNIVKLEESKVPAHLAGRIGAVSKLSTAVAGGIGGGGVPRISIKGSRFRIVDEGHEEVLPTLELRTVIVGANPRLTKSYYAEQWSPDQEPSNPDCFSLDGVTPDHSATAPQHTRCVDCPQNAWGSRTTQQGSKVKACTDQKRLAVVAADAPDGTVYLLQVTPAALKNLNGYHKELTSRGIPVEVVTTVIGFDTEASFPKLTFKFGGFLTPEQQLAVDKKFNSDEIAEITGEKIISALPVESKPTPTAPPVVKAIAAAPKPVPAPAPAPVAAKAPAPAPAPAKASGFGAPRVATAPAPTPAAPDPALASLDAEIEALINGKPDDAA